MRHLLLILSLCLISIGHAQDDKYLEKVKSIDNIMETLYGVISGEKGKARNWELFDYLFHKDAKLIPSGTSPQGKNGAFFQTTEQYKQTSGKWLVENGFFEQEIGRTVEQFGHIAHVFSTYQAFHAKNESKPFMRGINSVQLLYDGKRWWVLNTCSTCVTI